MGKTRDRRSFDNRERDFQNATKSLQENMSVVKELSLYTVAAAERLLTGEPVAQEPRSERMSAEHLLNQGEKVARSMVYIASIQRKKKKSRKSGKKGAKQLQISRSCREI